MTNQTPVERAAEALWNRMLDGLPETSRSEWRPWDNEAVGAIDWHQDARAVYDSIDTDQLADVLSTLTTCDGQPHASELHHRQARAVKNWLTGKDNQQ